MKALLVGGTGPTGPHIAHGLVQRGFELTLLHRGAHEAPGLPDCEHIHADPHFRETIDLALGGREFDVVVASYGRLRHLSAALAGRCERFISIGGTPAYLATLAPWKLRPFGGKIPIREDEEDVARDDAGANEGAVRFSHKVWQAEQDVFSLHDAGAFKATHFRFCRIYGPRQLRPAEWSIVRRVLDGRKWMILPDGGLEIGQRCAARNAAQYVLLAIDRPGISAGQIYNCGDSQQFTLRQILETIVEVMGGNMEMLSLPHRLARPAWALSGMQGASSHCLLDIGKACRELSYKDVISPRDAIIETVGWLVDNPIADEGNFPDRFDYDAEDRLIAAYERALAEVERAAPMKPPITMHSYAHPKVASLDPDHLGR